MAQNKTGRDKWVSVRKIKFFHKDGSITKYEKGKRDFIPPDKVEGILAQAKAWRPDKVIIDFN